MSIANIAALLKGAFAFIVAIPNITSGAAVRRIWVGTQAQYNAISTKDASTEYNIVG